MKTNAFTLSEVLITLGVIGVVAAITMPILIKKYQHKVLENQFKKSYAQLMYIDNLIINEYGSNCGYTTHPTDLYDFVESKLKIVRKYANTQKVHSKRKTYNLSETEATIHYDACNYKRDKGKKLILQDGSVLCIAHHNYQPESNILLGIDTNGPQKGPNAYGHDIFNFRINPQCKLEPIKGIVYTDFNSSNGYSSSAPTCSKNSTSDTNGFTCAIQALKNESPDDKNKAYFDNLP